MLKYNIGKTNERQVCETISAEKQNIMVKLCVMYKLRNKILKK